VTSLQRKTKETDIEIEVEVASAVGKYEITTGIGFFDHMLESFAKHSLIDITLSCNGDTEVDFHHSVEDVGIVLGQALAKEIFPLSNCERFADVKVVMDEAVVECVMDLSNRAYFEYDIDIDGKVGEFDCELAEEFFRALTINAGFSVHLVFIKGKNRHHIIEAAFKAYAIALRRALSKNDKIQIPSTKGVL
jgi:imidazoleglycerol-phosphate dehydratase